MHPIDEIVRLIPDLRRFARAVIRDRDKADDLVQDALERAVRNIGHWRGDGRLKSWLFQIMMNVHRDQARRYTVSRNVLTLEFPGSVDGGQEHKSELTEIGKALERLSADQRQILVLVAVEGFSIKEVARLLALPEGTVLSRLARARSNLRSLTGRDNENGASGAGAPSRAKGDAGS
jgi:RNA polymerase sigma-70 factor, ECF subfamily